MSVIEAVDIYDLDPLAFAMGGWRIESFINSLPCRTEFVNPENIELILNDAEEIAFNLVSQENIENSQTADIAEYAAMKGISFDDAALHSAHVGISMSRKAVSTNFCFA
jgi:hypothetical protein